MRGASHGDGVEWSRLRVEATDQGVRLDAFLPKMAQATRARARALIDQGMVLLNGKPPRKAGVLLAEGDIVEWQMPPPVPARAEAQDIPLEVLYQDADIIVVNKPRGMVVHPAAGHADGTLVNALLALCDGLSGVGGELRPGIVHRLDKDTTGLLVAAKNDSAHHALSQQMKDRTAGREYLAVVQGTMEGEGTIDAPIARHPRDRKRMAIQPNGREAITHWSALAALRGCTLLNVRLATGRTHQIRVHMRSIGHPVLGDPIYGFANDRTPVLLLHARRLRFTHPSTGEGMEFAVPPPEDYVECIRKRGYDGCVDDDEGLRRPTF